MEKIRSIVCIAAFIMCIAALAFAGIPQSINYQGYLKSSTTGAPAAGPMAMTFSLYSSSSPRNNPVWRETQPAVAISNGIYSVQLGSVNPITAPFDVPYYLGVQVTGDPTEMSLQPLSSAPYALRTALADSVSNNSIGTSSIADSSISTEKIADGAVTDTKITGPVSDNKLSENVTLLNSPQTVTGLKTFNPSGGTVPFAVDTTKNGVINNLNAEMVGSKTITDITAMIPAVYEPVMIRFGGSGSGTVASSPAGLSCSGNCVSEFSRGGSVVLTATADATSTFTGWSGAGCTGTGTCTVTADSAKTVEATFNRSVHSLTVTRTGVGTVVSDTGGINCGPSCSNSYAAGSVVRLTAGADPASTFIGWSGGSCSGTSACTVTINGATSVMATFSTNTHSLTVSRTGIGSGSVDSNPAGISCGTTCSTLLSSGTVVNLSATPDAGSSFGGWSGDCAGTGSCLATMSSAKSITAQFSKNSYPVTVAKTGTGNGTVTSSPAGISCGGSCSASYSSGQTLTLTAAADANSTFDGWSGACSGTGSCNVTVDAAKGVTANFTRKTYAVTVTRTGGGTVTSSTGGIYCGSNCQGNLPSGDSVTFTAAADPGFTFAGWSGACSGTSTCTLPIDGAKSLSARFTAPLTAARAGTGNGTVTSSPAGISCGATCTGSYDGAASVTLTATPDSTSTFTGWSGVCSGTGSCIVTVDGARSAIANFSRNTVPISVLRSGTGGGRVTSSPAGIDCGAICTSANVTGSSVTLTAAPDATSTVAGWSGCDSTTLATCTVVANSARDVTVNFTRTTHTATIIRSGNGTITSAPVGIDCGTTCSAGFTQGDVIILSATPAPDNTFSGWSGGGCSGTGTCAVTMSAAQNITGTFTHGSIAEQTVISGLNTRMGLVVQGAPAQAANLQEWQDSSGASLASISSAGIISGNGSGLTNVAPANGSVTAIKLADSAITGPKIASGAVTDAKISGPISASKVASSIYSISGNVTPIPGLAADFVFVGPTVLVNTTANQKITGTIQTSLGSYDVPSSQPYGYGLCYQANGSGSPPSTMEEGNYNIAEVTNLLVPVSVAASRVMGPGLWNIGFCVYNAYDYSIDYTTNINGWVMVTN